MRTSNAPETTRHRHGEKHPAISLLVLFGPCHLVCLLGLVCWCLYLSVYFCLFYRVSPCLSPQVSPCLFPVVSPCFNRCLPVCFLGCLFLQVSPWLFPRMSVCSGVSLSVSSGACFLRCLPVCFLRCLPGPCGASASSLTGSAGKGRARAVARCWWRRSAEGRSAPSCSRKARAAASAASPTAVSLIGQSSATVQPRAGKGKGRSWRFAGVKGTSLCV